MAQTEDDLDLDLGEEDEVLEEAPKRAGGWIKWAVIGLLGTTLIGGSVIAGLYFFTDMFVAENEMVAEQADAEPGKKVKKSKKDKKKKKKKSAKEKKPKVPQVYFSLKPAFVVNFGETSSVRFLQLTIQVSTRQPDSIELMKEHMPAIRNNILLLLSDQVPAVLNSRAGKLELRKNVLKEIRQVLKEQTGESYVENVYFTSFVMQ
ncbi:MAG: hypothetical protein GXP22_10485 [Gammaproteobacteria bacterium]|nr:hypothetical protein [Gammaproteobacteria bacterium]